MVSHAKTVMSAQANAVYACLVLWTLAERIRGGKFVTNEK